MSNVFEQIQAYNQGRNPDLVQRKYKCMGQDAFAFMRGSCHLFYQDWPQDSSLNQAPPVWSCGDLHLENFGSYKGDDRLVYFDINDFDEAVLAPCTWDLTRCVTSILVAGCTLKVDQADAQTLCEAFLQAYTDALSLGKARTIKRETATGMVCDLLESLRKRKRRDFLAERTRGQGKERQLRIGKDFKTLAVQAADRERMTHLFTTWAETQPDPDFFKLLDIAYRPAGIGSLGVERYMLLVEGKGSPDDNYLLDLKAETGSCLQPYLPLPQLHWTSQAERVVWIQQQMQESPPARLHALQFNGQSYLLRELQPTADQVKLKDWNEKLKRLLTVLRTMAELLAWSQLRSGGRQGSAIADTLIAFSLDTPQWQPLLVDYARHYAAQIVRDYQDFCAATDQKAAKDCLKYNL